MVRQAGLFSQLLKLVPRTEFERLVRQHEAEKGAKGFTCWNQSVAMLFCISGTPTRCARSATGWPVVWASWFTWVCAGPPSTRPCPAPTATVPAQRECPQLRRRVVVWDATNEREIVLLTNRLEFGATAIAAIYKERWGIEIFCKALKQHLKIKAFVGTSENAPRIQIWTALIALLLLKWLQHRAHASWSFSNLATMVRLNLFTYPDLLA